MNAQMKPSTFEAPGRAPVTAARARGSFESRALRRLLSAFGNPPLEFHLWNGERVAAPGVSPIHSVRIADRATFFGLVRDPQLRFGDGYSAGRIQVEGDLIQFMDGIYRGLARIEGGGSLALRLANWLRRPRGNTLGESRDNIHHHYDLGNEFYSLWLGATMAYTCAYYPTRETTLDEAQVAKMDHVCRKLRLRAGDRVVEAGCGWGSLALHMASRYGAQVRAFNISREQVDYARRKARELGLSAQVEFVEDDYRNISGTWDAFASVGMLEHVGVENYREFGRIIRRSLAPSGRGLVHSIGRNRPARLHPWIERRIFPGAYAPSLGEMMQIFEPWDLSVTDVENLRLHYALTLRHWLERYEAAAERVRRLFDEKFVSMWRLYLAGSVAAFESGTLQLFQVAFTTAQNNDLPLTRQHLHPG